MQGVCMCIVNEGKGMEENYRLLQNIQEGQQNIQECKLITHH